MTLAHRFRRLLAAPLRRHPFALQRLRWPNPFQPPYRQSEINLFRPGEMGDVIMCLAVIRAIRERNPKARITFITKYTDLLRDHPLLDEVMTEEEARARGLRRIISLRYEVFVPLRLHVIDYLAGCVGLRRIGHTIPLPRFEHELGALAAMIPTGRPRIVINRQAGPFTPNKDWPAGNWNQLVAHLCRQATVIEVGTSPGPGADRPLSGTDDATAPAPIYVDLRGRTTVRQFCAVIALADLVITPVTSAVHIAAAYDVPTLSIIGGYEHPANTAYPRHTALHRSLPCSPCWLTTPCPHDRACLRQIGVEEVAATALRLLST